MTSPPMLNSRCQSVGLALRAEAYEPPGEAVAGRGEGADVEAAEARAVVDADADADAEPETEGGRGEAIRVPSGV
jgi:hypothetical protein